MIRFINASGNDLGQGLLSLFKRGTCYASPVQSENPSGFKEALTLPNHKSLDEVKSASYDMDNQLSPTAIAATHNNNYGDSISNLEGKASTKSTTIDFCELDLSSGGVQRGTARFELRVSQSM